MAFEAGFFESFKGVEANLQALADCFYNYKDQPGFFNTIRNWFHLGNQEEVIRYMIDYKENFPFDKKTMRNPNAMHLFFKLNGYEKEYKRKQSIIKLSRKIIKRDEEMSQPVV